MTSSKKFRLSLLAVLTASVSSTAFSAGFQINEHSTNGLGRAMAGQAAMPENATVLATNPAAITVFDSPTLSGSLSFIDPEIDIRGDISTNLSADTVSANIDDIADTAFVPSAFFVAPINGRWSYGLGLFSTYGLTTDYSDSYNGLHFADKAEVLSVTFNPAIAYQVTEELSIGFGLTATYSDAQIGTSTPQAISARTGGAVPGNATIVKMQGDDWGFGWNTGIFWQLTKQTDLAFSYRAETELNMDGDIKSDLVASYNQGGQLALNFAAVTEFAINHKINKQWSIQASANHTDWSTFDKLEAHLNDGSSVLLKEENFEDSWRYSFGTTFQYSNELTLRAGFAIDEGAVSDEHRSLSIPDTDRHWYSAGVTYTLSQNDSLDIALVHIKGDDASVNEHSAIGSVVSELNATQHGKANILSIQFNSSF